MELFRNIFVFKMSYIRRLCHIEEPKIQYRNQNRYCLNATVTTPDDRYAIDRDRKHEAVREKEIANSTLVAAVA